MNTAIIFSLLLVLMLTGMPISIVLGLAVLTFLFTMTQVPIESVALKLSARTGGEARRPSRLVGGMPASQGPKYFRAPGGEI